MSKIIKTALLLGMLSLSACISGKQHGLDTYTNKAGDTTVIETDHETCTRSCNQDYSRCMDTEPAHTSGVNGPAGMFGASADCRNNLKQCMLSCGGK